MQILIYSLFLFYSISFVTKRGQILNNIYVQRFFLSSFILLSLFISIASGIDYIDRSVYTSQFFTATQDSFGNFLEKHNDSLMFYIITFLITKITSNPEVYYVFMHLLFLYFLIRGLYLIFNKNLYVTVLAFFIFLNFTIYYSYTLNILRQGLAFVIIIYSIGCILNYKQKRFYLILFTAPFVHWTSLFFTLLVIVSRKIKTYNTFTLIIIYTIFSTLYLTHTSDIFTNQLSFILPTNSEGYLSLNRIEQYGGSYKVQFWFFNTIFFILLMSPLIFKKLFDLNKLKNYDVFFYYYTITSSVFFLFGFIPFADRIAGYSWLLIPILLAQFINSIKISNYLKFLLLIIMLIVGFISTPLNGRFF